MKLPKVVDLKQDAIVKRKYAIMRSLSLFK
jgi:hypothetical protein